MARQPSKGATSVSSAHDRARAFGRGGSSDRTNLTFSREVLTMEERGDSISSFMDSHGGRTTQS
jgi:hypothetical protein